MKKRKQTAKRKALEVASQSHRAFNHAIQIEDYLRMNLKKGNTQFLLEVKQNGLDALGVEISPLVKNDGYVFKPANQNNIYLGYVMRFNIEPKGAIDNLMKFLREKTNDRIEA